MGAQGGNRKESADKKSNLPKQNATFFFRRMVIDYRLRHSGWLVTCSSITQDPGQEVAPMLLILGFLVLLQWLKTQTKLWIAAWKKLLRNEDNKHHWMNRFTYVLSWSWPQLWYFFSNTTLNWILCPQSHHEMMTWLDPSLSVECLEQSSHVRLWVAPGAASAESPFARDPSSAVAAASAFLLLCLFFLLFLPLSLSCPCPWLYNRQKMFLCLQK